MPITKIERQWDPKTQTYNERTVVSFTGRVFSTYHREYKAMSDVYTHALFAEVIELDGSLREILVNANFECDLSMGRAEEDALPEFLFLHKMHQDMQAIEKQKFIEAEARAAEERERNRPVVGKRMIVMKGRKVPVGSEGTVAYIKDGDILLKPHDSWRDRKANGVWVRGEYLKAL